jgi:hypothetical protein
VNGRVLKYPALTLIKISFAGGSYNNDTAFVSGIFSYRRVNADAT